MPKKSQKELHSMVQVGPLAPTNTSNLYASSAFGRGDENVFTMDSFKKGFGVEVLQHDEEKIVFDMFGIDTPIANAFRRILLAEVPTMAIDKVIVYNNTSIIQDEVLCHRIGLVPVKADPRSFDFPPPVEKVDAEQEATVRSKEPDENFHESMHIKFKLQKKCYKENGEMVNEKVYSSALEWVPIGNQAETFKDNPPRPVHSDIVIAQLRPGQEIDLELICEKGIGATHAKWSPVATASYRLLPHIEISDKTPKAVAEEAHKLCPMKVFDIEDAGLVASRPRNCTMCRECVRETHRADHIKLMRKKDHFIWSVESVGILPPAELVREAILVLKAKCVELREALDGLDTTAMDQD